MNRSRFKEKKSRMDEQIPLLDDDDDDDKYI